MRLHATAKAGGLAASFMLIAALLVEPSLGLFLKVLFIILMILFTTAQAAHMIARSSLAGSIEHPQHDALGQEP
jgi:multisubunit Na+/H+ antiporter MnhG subunit